MNDKPFPPFRKPEESQAAFGGRLAREPDETTPTPERELRATGRAYLDDPDANRDAFAECALNVVLHDHLTAEQVAHVSGVPLHNVIALVDEHRS